MDEKIRIFILQTAVDIVPYSWRKKESIVRYYKKFKRYPLMNASDHQHWIREIPKIDRKDRPDILHFGLLTALGYAKVIDCLEIYFNLGKTLYKIDNDTRIPRDQKRFYGILETILSDQYNGNFIKKTNESISVSPIVFTKDGEDYSKNMWSNDLIFGGFATGSLPIIRKGEKRVSISQKELDLWTAISIALNKLLPN